MCYMGHTNKPVGKSASNLGQFDRVHQGCPKLDSMGEQVNLRDMSTVAADILRYKTVYRSSEVVGPDVLRDLGIKSVIDLRETKHSSIKEDQEAKQTQRALGFVSKVSRSALTFITQKASAEPQPCKRCSQRLCDKDGGNSVNVFHAGILKPRAKGAVFCLMPLRIQIKAIGGLLKGRGPKEVVQPAVGDPNEMGFSAFYAAVLSHGKSRIAIALKVLLKDGALPCVIHCTHGKDRTGVIIMLLLLLCNVPTEAIEEDYSHSEGELQDAEEKPDPDIQLGNSFMRSSGVRDAHPDTMSKTIQHLKDQYGSVDNYIRDIGISDEEIAKLRERLCKPGAAPIQSTAVQHHDDNEGVSFQPKS